MYAYHKAKRSFLSILIGLFAFAEMCIPAHAVLFGCLDCCEEDFSPEELTEKISAVNHHFGRYKISIEQAREICPQAVKSELERRFMAYGSKLETYLLSDVAHFYILHAHSMLDLDKHCVYFIMGPDKYAYQEIPPDSYEFVSDAHENSEQEINPLKRRQSTSSTASSPHRRLVSHASTSSSISETEDDMFVSSGNLAQLKLFVPSLPRSSSHSFSSSFSHSSSSSPLAKPPFSPPNSPRPSPSSSPRPLGKSPIRVRMKLPEHQKIDLGGFTWNPPFGNINPLEGLIILCGDTDLVNKTCNGNLESSFWGPVGAGGLIYTEHNHSWVRPGDLITTLDKAIKEAKRMRKKLAKSFDFGKFLRTGKHKSSSHW